MLEIDKGGLERVNGKGFLLRSCQMYTHTPGPSLQVIGVDVLLLLLGLTGKPCHSAAH